MSVYRTIGPLVFLYFYRIYEEHSFCILYVWDHNTPYASAIRYELILQVIVAYCFEKEPEICSESRQKNKLN